MDLTRLFKIRKAYADQEREYWQRYKADYEPETTHKIDIGTLYERNVNTPQIHNFEAEIVDNRLNWCMGKAIDIDFYEDTPQEEIDRQNEIIKRFYRVSRLNVKVKDFGRWLLATGRSAMICYQPTTEAADDVDVFVPEIYDCAWDYQNGVLTEFARRYVKQEDENIYYAYCDYYTPDEIKTFKSAPYSDCNSAMLADKFDEEVSTDPNMFGIVPVVMTELDECARPCFYPVLSLIDSYNNLCSSATDQFNTFAQSYLVLTNYMLTNDDLGKVDTEQGRLEALEKLKKLRVLLMDDAGKAEFLKREVQVEAFDSLRILLEKNIDRFGRNINYADPEVLGKATNLTINTRTKPIDNASNDFADIIETQIIDLIKICNQLWETVGKSIDPYTVNVVFSYDKPANLPEEAIAVQTLVNAGVMLQDALRVGSFCENPQEWADRAEESRQAKIDEYLRANPDGEDTEGNEEQE
ncbi:phage portal protein [Sulfurimonas sp.]|uniref:phage portal protein n=1 Tax=Sulfurimonas sp. TaxID=2022749 RepID=UPI0025FA912A|nr:phage portal protein [Sulfurimonas sp.]MCK9474072.1 phage portal protein [Sulfurimonas sp.]